MIELLIIGDSLSAAGYPYKSWAQYVEPEQAVVRNLAQVGLSLDRFDLPAYIYPRALADRAIALVYIGTNDAGMGVDVRTFEIRLTYMTHYLAKRGYEVWLVAQPELDIHAEVLEEYRHATEDVADDYGYHYIDPHWGTDSTVDGVHPDQFGQIMLYYWFMRELGL